jgi:hypothetical protein
VISLSTCSGGIPEKKVATSTTGMFMDGNISTGMRKRLLRPSTVITRQATTIKYGVRMENPDI